LNRPSTAAFGGTLVLVTGNDPDLAALLATPDDAAVELWADPLSPATSILMAELDLDGHTNGGRPWQVRGRDRVALRLLPEPGDQTAELAACAVLTARAWAVLREAGDPIVPMAYEVPWSLLAGIARDHGAVREFGLPHLITLAAHEGDWLGDWLAEYVRTPAVLNALEGWRASAAGQGIGDLPTVVARGVHFPASTMPDDIRQRVIDLVDLGAEASPVGAEAPAD
jgi:hypothetical protein